MYWMSCNSLLSPKRAKSLAPYTPEGLVQRDLRAARIRRWQAAVVSLDVEIHAEVTHPDTIFPCELVLTIRKKIEAGEQLVKHSEVIAEVARRLPHRTQRDVAEVVDLLTEIWSDTLMDGDTVSIPSIGRLTLEVQMMEAGGVLKQHGTLCRIYGRFRPTERLKEQLNGKT